MKFSSSTIWVLGALMAFASIDAVPDPPAIVPHAIKAAAHPCKVPAGINIQHADCHWSYPISYLQARWITGTSVYEPTLPGNSFARTEHAADASPPTRAVRKRFFIQS